MKKLLLALPAAALLTAAATDDARAQTQTVTFEVQAINQMSVSGNPGALVINAAAAGSSPTAVSDASTTWAITTNQTGTKVTASLDQAMPTGVTLTVQLQAPSGATSKGAVALGDTDADLVTGITKLNESGRGVTYSLTATAAAGVVANATRTVTYTVVAGT